MRVQKVDFDGYASSALFINYLHNLFPTFVENHIVVSHHFGKMHGLIDVIDEALNYKYVLMIDSSSNDKEQHQKLLEQGTKLLIIDHHIVDVEPIESEDLVIINNQYSDYPHKFFCGANIAWLFCKYFDKIMNVNYADKYLDLSGFAAIVDMMDIRDKYTKAIIFEGLKEDNIKNPFLEALCQRNQFSLSGSDYKSSGIDGMVITPIGVGFFVGPFINACTRSGTQEEKMLIFESMLEWKAYEKVPSTKRGEKGRTEFLVTQAVRTITNIKRRQDNLVAEGMNYLEERIAADNMLEHNILLFTIESGEIPPALAGLAANKIMHKYNKCTSVLTLKENGEYIGSNRGCTIPSYKDWLENTHLVKWAMGHDQAFGCSLPNENVNDLLSMADSDAGLAATPITFVDYYWSEQDINKDVILALTKTNNYIGTGISRPILYIHNLTITSNMVHILGEKRNTLKIDSKVPIMKFGITEEEVNDLIGKTVNLFCKPNANEWCGNVTPQLVIEDIEIVSQSNINWGF